MEDNNTYGFCNKWQKMLFYTNIFLAIITVVGELLLVYTTSDSIINGTVEEYQFRYLAAPTICSLMILFSGSLLAKSFPGNHEALNYIPLVQQALLCFVIAGTHYEFSCTLGLLSFPIFMTAVFGDKKMSMWMTELSILLYFIVLLIRGSEMLNGRSDVNFIPEAIIGLVLIFLANVLSHIFLLYQRENDKKQRDAFLFQLSRKDELNKDKKTGLYGDTAFHNSLSLCVEEAKQDGSTLVLTLLDIDDFAQINETYGWSLGDGIIERLSALMWEYCGEEYLPARYEGGKFAIIFPEETLQQVYAIIEVLRIEFAATGYPGIDMKVTLSAGIAALREQDSAQMLFKRANAALKCSKQNGKNRTTIRGGKKGQSTAENLDKNAGL